jgi:hypothetical protein
MNRFLHIAPRLALGCAVALGLAACGGGSDDGSKSQTGTLKLGITDAPIDQALQVVVRFDAIEFKPKGGKAFVRTLATPRDIDLIQFQGTNRTLLFDEDLPAGEYEWMRLSVVAEPNVVDSFIALEAGGQCELRVPSGSESGLKLIRGFTVGVGTTTDLTLDFDVRRSIVQPPGQSSDATDCGGQNYLLKPVVRVVDTLQVGAIAGNVDLGLRTACAASPVAPGSVYLFGPYASGETPPVPDDYDGLASPDDADAISSALVDDMGNYTLGFVPPGKYVVAHTCGPDDTTADNDAIAPAVNFTPPTGIAADVAANMTTTVDFVSPPST